MITINSRFRDCVPQLLLNCISLIFYHGNVCCENKCKNKKEKKVKNGERRYMVRLPFPAVSTYAPEASKALVSAFFCAPARCRILDEIA
jgi:hypothetical protein